MRGKAMFLAGAAVGYVLGTRAGRERFDQMMAKARQLWESNTLQEAGGVVRAQAGRLYDDGKRRITDQAQKFRHRHDDLYDEPPNWDSPMDKAANTY
jgi:hypothetical protein